MDQKTLRMSRKTGRSESQTAESAWPLADSEYHAVDGEGSSSNGGNSSSRRKTRRLEFTTLDTIQQEVSMYLDSVANQGDALPDTAAVDAALHEAFRVLTTCWSHGGSRLEAFETMSSLSPITTSLLLTFGHHQVTEDGNHLVLRDGPGEMPRVGALLAVLRSLILSRARADALVARRQQQRRADSRGSTDVSGTRQLPASSLSSVSPFSSYNLHQGSSALSIPSTQPYTSSLALAGESSQNDPPTNVAQPPLPPHHSNYHPERNAATPPPNPISRLIALNCHTFGWLDSLGRDDYERNARTLQQASAGLESLVRDPACASVGRPPVVAEARRRMGKEAVTVVPARTTVLLSDAILMEGGVPSLSLYPNSTTLTAHHQYGRGLACLVPEFSSPAAALAPPPLPPAWQPVTDSRGYFVSPPSTALPPARMASNEESPGNSQLATPATGPLPARGTGGGGDVEADDEEETWMDRHYHSAVSATATPTLPPASAPSSDAAPLTPSLTAAASLYAATDFAPLKPVSCGAHSLPGMAAQAVLLSPAGPLVLHVQFDPRTAAAQPLATASSISSIRSSGGGSTVAATVEEAMIDSCRRLSCSTASSMGRVSGSPGPASPRRRLSSGGGEQQGDAVLVAAAHAREVLEWILQLLRCPQAALLVEWHLDSERDVSSPSLAGAAAANSAVLRLLQSCAEACKDQASQSPTSTNDSSSGGGPRLEAAERGEDQSFCERVHDTVGRFSRWPASAAPQPDGQVRPILFARGLELAWEGERVISEGIVATSLQYRSIQL